jgi:nucleotide-binding universal stress UspA family protein
MLKLLIPVDGSDCSLHAVQHAIKLAKADIPVSVTLLYVYEEQVPFGAITAHVPRERIGEIEREFVDPALAEAERLLRAANVEYERELRVADDVAPMIAHRAEELGCDGIIMGTHGGGVLANVLMGSTTRKVVHMVKTPVTMVR